MNVKSPDLTAEPVADDRCLSERRIESLEAALSKTEGKLESAINQLRIEQQAKAVLNRRCETLARELAIASRFLRGWGLCGPKPLLSGIPYTGPGLSESRKALYHIDRVEVWGPEVIIEGWAFDPENRGLLIAAQGVLVRSAAGQWLMFPAFQVRRPDVLAHFANTPELEFSGFHAVLPGDLWPGRCVEFAVAVRGENGAFAFTPLIGHTIP
jgi:hypothetical protein